MAKNYKLPNGHVALDFDHYMQAWSAITEPLAQAVGCSVMAFDPDIQLRDEHRSFTLPLWAAERFAARLQPNA